MAKLLEDQSWNLSQFTKLTKLQIKMLREDNERYLNALTLIRNVAEVSEGVEWYKLIANQGIEGKK